VIPFNLDGVPHALVAAILGYEGGIGVRSGCFCAQPYVSHLLGLSGREASRLDRERTHSGGSHRPGMVRISLAAYNSAEDIDALVEMLLRVARGDYQGVYEYIVEAGNYVPIGAGSRDLALASD
jgi:selenocysteine lyase/cysteine desulfurase